ncbi:MAG: hypothetical protein IPL67_19440 [Ignavibacteria bacterium]|nr:hypothetical protein [Ignavibacteria bacterium]
MPLIHDYAHAPDGSSVDSINIETSTNGGSSYSVLVRLYGSASASGQYALNTATAPGSAFTPNAKSMGIKVMGTSCRNK